MKRIQLTLLTFALLFGSVCAQQPTDNPKYRRSSIYSVLVNHTDQQFGAEIKEAFLQIPVPDKFNDHNLSVKVLTLDKKLTGAKSNDENPEISAFLSNNKVASRLVGKWFDRNTLTGECNMELVKERGLYNATEFDKQMAQRSSRGIALLQDAGEELIGNTFVIVNDIRYVDKAQKSKAAGSIIKGLGSLLSTVTNVDVTSITDNVGDLVGTLKGFSVRINTFLYKLDWTNEQALTFYKEQYTAKPDEQKRDNFDKARGNYTLKYVGKVESRGGTTSFMGIKEDEPILMVRKACQRAIDENLVDLQRNYIEFRSKTPLLSTEPLTAYIGMKEGLTPDVKFEVLEAVEEKDGSISYKRVGIVQPITGMIWDNRFMATEEGSVGSNLTFTTFRVLSGKDFTPGMLLREMSNE